jgi:hypothetical protein
MAPEAALAGRGCYPPPQGLGGAIVLCTHEILRRVGYRRETANIANIGVKRQVMTCGRRAGVFAGALETANTGTGNREHPARDVFAVPGPDVRGPGGNREHRARTLTCPDRRMFAMFAMFAVLVPIPPLTADRLRCRMR